MHQTDESVGAPAPAIVSLGGYLIGPLFLILAAWFYFAPIDDTYPTAPTPQFSLSELEVGPLRQPLGDPPTTVIAGFTQRCNVCHSLFESTWDGSRPLTQHREVVLAHGVNDACLNCHDRDNRERLVTRSGDSIPYSEVATLCRQCHGPVYRDWTRGVHGKTLGYWNSHSGEPQKLTCSACHDPHSPTYAPYSPLPGPNTLRMGKQGDDVHAEVQEARSPLRRWQTHTGEAEHEPEGGDH